MHFVLDARSDPFRYERPIPHHMFCAMHLIFKIEVSTKPNRASVHFQQRHGQNRSLGRPQISNGPITTPAFPAHARSRPFLRSTRVRPHSASRRPPTMVPSSAENPRGREPHSYVVSLQKSYRDTSTRPRPRCHMLPATLDVP